MSAKNNFIEGKVSDVSREGPPFAKCVQTKVVCLGKGNCVMLDTTEKMDLIFRKNG